MQAGEVAGPAVDDRDLRLDVHAAGVNVLDAKIRDEEPKLFRGPAFVVTRASRCASCRSWVARQHGYEPHLATRPRSRPPAVPVVGLCGA
jgi:hypothetical protein